VTAFVVERYVPRGDAAHVKAFMASEREAIARLAPDAGGVRHIRSTYLPEDELCFSLFEAPSLEAVRDANERAGLAFERITEAYDLTVEGAEDRA
jgi:hypothetical protein